MIVTISRYWNNPQINIDINESLISLSIPLKDFLYALKQEIDSVTFTFTKGAFDSQFDMAASKVIEKIKEESHKAV